MINIKDKLNRTNILLHRDKIINADNISSEQFNDDIEQINEQINDLNDVVADSLKQDIFENETKLINSDLELIEEKIENRPAVITKIDAFSYNFSNSTFVTFPTGFDFSNCVDTQYIFSMCRNLTEFTEPIYLDKCLTAGHTFHFCDSLTGVTLENTGKFIDTQGMFYNCKKLTNVNLFDTSNVTNMTEMFNFCENLTSVPLFDTSNVTNMTEMFYNCRKLTTIPQLNTSKVEYMSNMVAMCKKLKSIPLLDCTNINTYFDFNIFGYSQMDSLVDLGGFKNIKANIQMYQCLDLTHQSLMNVITNLYDFRGNGNGATKTLKLSGDSYNLLSESDKLVATNKGWIITY